jgi:hypothetical protein
MHSAASLRSAQATAVSVSDTVLPDYRPYSRTRRDSRHANHLRSPRWRCTSATMDTSTATPDSTGRRLRYNGRYNGRYKGRYVLAYSTVGSYRLHTRYTTHCRPATDPALQTWRYRARCRPTADPLQTRYRPAIYPLHCHWLLHKSPTSPSYAKTVPMQQNASIPEATGPLRSPCSDDRLV